MSGPGAVDILEAGRPQRRRLRPRTRAVLLVAALVVTASGVVVDRQVRAREQAALDRCAVATDAAVRRASGLIGYMVGYVRPTLAGLPDGEVRDGIYELVSGAAVKALPATDRADATCGAVKVLAFHDAQRSRHEACLALLSVTRTHLERVRDDGRSAFVDGSTRRELLHRCTGGQ